jgi:hypothetical protein
LIEESDTTATDTPVETLQEESSWWLQLSMLLECLSCWVLSISLLHEHVLGGD